MGNGYEIHPPNKTETGMLDVSTARWTTWNFRNV